MAEEGFQPGKPRFSLQCLGRTESGIGVGPGMAAVEIQTREESGTGLAGVPPPKGMSEAPDRPTMGIIRPADIGPPALVRHPVVPSARHSPSYHEVEVEVDVQLRKGSGQDDQSSSIVVGGVAQAPTRSI
jgi:hypothetical protein